MEKENLPVNYSSSRVIQQKRTYCYHLYDGNISCIYMTSSTQVSESEVLCFHWSHSTSPSFEAVVLIHQGEAITVIH